MTDAESCTSNDKITDLTRFSTVWDLTCCPTTFHKGYYHRLVDCLMPSMSTWHKALQNHDHTAKVAIIPDYLSDFYDIILPESSSTERLLQKSRGTSCYLVSTKDAVVTKEAEDADFRDMWTAFHEAMLRGLASRPDVTKPLSMTAPRSDTDSANIITLIQRHGQSRVFANADDILEALHAEFPSWHIQVYHGNETATQTMALFAPSKIIIGYHGAGLANALFSPAGTIVLEFTTMKDIGSRALWRTNAVIERIHPNLTWIQHAVDLDHLDNGPGSAGTFLDAVRSSPDRDHLIKNIKRIFISPSVLLNAISRVKKEMAAQGV